MSVIHEGVEWAGEHPLGTAVIVVGAGLVILYISGAFSGSSSASNSTAANSANSNAVSSFYAAEAAQTQSGNALQAVQIQANASTAQTQIAATAQTQQAALAAHQNILMNSSDNNAALGEAALSSNTSEVLSANSTIAALAPYEPVGSIDYFPLMGGFNVNSYDAQPGLTAPGNK
jgi:hypothetical protein